MVVEHRSLANNTETGELVCWDLSSPYYTEAHSVPVPRGATRVVTPACRPRRWAAGSRRETASAVARVYTRCFQGEPEAWQQAYLENYETKIIQKYWSWRKPGEAKQQPETRAAIKPTFKTSEGVQTEVGGPSENTLRSNFCNPKLCEDYEILWILG